MKQISDHWSQLQAILENLNEGLVIADQDGNLIHWNQAALQMLGFSRLDEGLHPLKDFAGLFELSTLDGLVLTLEQWPMARLLQGESSCQLELYTRRLHGDWERILRYSGSHIRLAADQSLAFLILTDITEQKRAEALLRTSMQLTHLSADIGYALTQSTPLNASLQACCEILVAGLDAAFARIWLLDDAGQMLELYASAGLYTHLDGAHARVPVGRYKIGLIAEQRLPHLTNDVQHDPRVSDKAWAVREGMVAFAGYPLICEERLLGVMALFARHPLSAATTQAMAAVAGSIALGIERRCAEETLFAEKERAQITLKSIGDAVITTDRQGRIEYLNPVAETLTGWPLVEACGQPLEKVFNIVDEITREPPPDQVARCLAQQQTTGPGHQTILLSRSGAEFAIEDSSAPIRDRKGHILGAVLVFRDVTRQRRLTHEINYQATHDGLTGLLNRREFEHRLRRVLETAHSDRSQHALCFLDLDRFKIVNDSCGHAAGDELLRQLAELLRSRMRWRDTLARLGGDEFGLLLEHCPPEQAELVADSLRAAVEDFMFVWEGNSFRVGVSIGLVPIDAASGKLDTVLQAADNACYLAKGHGRNQVQIYNEQNRDLARQRVELNWVSRLQDALQNNRFVLYAQLISPVNAAAGAGYTHGMGCELLLRLPDNSGDVILPGAFMPAAERYQLAIHIDRWVVDQLVTVFSRQAAQLARLELCAVNLSAHSCNDAQFQKYLLERLDSLGEIRAKICFEITETAAITNLTQVARFIKTLKTRGCRFALDDFGSGLSSFAYLKTLPVDFLKIDGILVKDIVADPIDLALVRSINEIAQLLGKQTIAEYVENEMILEQLRELGVDYAQGYHIDRPRPLQDLLEGLLSEDLGKP